MHKIISKIIALASKKWMDKKLCLTVKKIFFWLVSILVHSFSFLWFFEDFSEDFHVTNSDDFLSSVTNVTYALSKSITVVTWKVTAVLRLSRGLGRQIWCFENESAFKKCDWLHSFLAMEAKSRNQKDIPESCKQ